MNTGAEAAARLAEAVRAQWAYELAALGISSPFPLAVSWSPADPLLAEPWEALVAWTENPMLGRRRTSYSFDVFTGKRSWRPPPPDTWATGLDGLAPGQTGPWDAVIAKLDTPGPLGQALSTPLMAGLAREIYGRPEARTQQSCWNWPAGNLSSCACSTGSLRLPSRGTGLLPGPVPSARSGG